MIFDLGPYGILFWGFSCLYMAGLSFALWLDLKKNRKLKPNLHSHRLSIIIPFKNEAQNLPRLIHSINESYLPGNQIIFINDHSHDNGEEIIRDQANFPFEILKVPEGFSGKKSALHAGINQAKNAFVLSLDADIVLPSSYFESLRKMEWADLNILPVGMNAETPFQKWAALEFDFLQHLGQGLAGAGKPELCNGANLLFSKRAYQESASIRQDWEIPSGDDVFLLNAMKHLGKSIKSNANEKLRVETPAPKNWEELLSQRNRWIQKMKGRLSRSQWISGGFLLLSQFSFYPLFFLTFLEPSLSIPLLIKLISERISSKDSSFSALVIHQFWYPYYLLKLALYPRKGNQKWK